LAQYVERQPIVYPQVMIATESIERTFPFFQFNSTLLCTSASGRLINWKAFSVSFMRKQMRSAHFQTRPYAWPYFCWSLVDATLIAIRDKSNDFPVEEHPIT